MMSERGAEEQRTEERRKGERRKDIESARHYVGMQKRLDERRHRRRRSHHGATLSETSVS